MMYCKWPGQTKGIHTPPLYKSPGRLQGDYFGVRGGWMGGAAGKNIGFLGVLDAQELTPQVDLHVKFCD